MTPDNEVATRIVNAFVEQGWVEPGKAGALVAQIAAGEIDESSWKLLAEISLASAPPEADDDAD